jgi:hypothetical protein
MFMKRFICILITSIILLADSGQMIYAHTCLKSGNVSLSLTKPGANCCPVPEVKHSCCAKKEALKKAAIVSHKACCALSAKYIKQSFPTNKAEVEKKIELPVVVLPLNIFKAYAVSTGNYILAQSNAPPIIQGEEHISFTQVIRC